MCVVCAGCAFKWCEYTPAVQPAQFYLSYAINSISFPYNIAICQAMFRCHTPSTLALSSMLTL